MCAGIIADGPPAYFTSGMGSTTSGGRWALARHQLGRAKGVSLAIAVFAGMIAAVPMALFSTARYGDGAFDRFVEWSDPPELTVNICPPGVDPSVDGVDACLIGADLEADARQIADLAHVRSAVVGGYVFGLGGTDASAAASGPPTGGLAVTGDLPTAAGRPIVVEGRVADRDSADEITLSEKGARQLDIGVGDQLHLTAPGSEVVASSRVVGVVRVVDHLLPVDELTSPVFHVREGWLAANEGAFLNYAAVLVQVEEGHAGEVAAAIPDAFEGRAVNTEHFLPSDERRISNQALDLESGSLVVLAIASAVAAAALVAQIVSRRNRSELREVDTLRAIGATDRFLVGAVLLRWLPVMVGAVLVAVVAAALVPAMGPFGVARRAPWSAAPRFDWSVILVGVVLIPCVVMAPALLTVRRRPPGPLRAGPAVGRTLVSRIAVTFLRRSFERRSIGSMGTAVVVSAAALGCLMGALTVTASLDRVVSEPARYGAPFDALVPAAGGLPENLAEMDGIVDAASFVGADLQIGDEVVWAQALAPFEELPLSEPVVFEGRAPVTADEVALAPITLRETGMAVGDEIEIPTTDGDTALFEVVGVAPITDGYEHNVGLGGLFTVDGLARLDSLAPTNVGDVGVRVDRTRRDEILAAVRQDHPATFVPFPVPSSLGNASRISGLPVLLALAGAVAAAATFAHALLVATRLRQRDLAVLRVLGMLRRQAFGVVAAMAAVIAGFVAILGGLAGMVLGRWGWRFAAASFGVDPSATFPMATLVVAPLMAVAVALAAAAWPAWRASNVRPARALRTD